MRVSSTIRFCLVDNEKIIVDVVREVPDKTDAVPLIDSFGHRPGFAFVNDAATREARARMYALKDVEYENAWRGYGPTNKATKPPTMPRFF
jgi:hypothetical protein